MAWPIPILGPGQSLGPSALAVLAALLAAGSAACVVVLASGGVSAAVRTRQIQRTAGVDGALGRFARTGVAALLPLCEVLLRFGPLDAACRQAARAMALRYPGATPQAACSLAVAGLAACGLAGFLAGSAVAGALAGVVALVAAHARCGAVLEARSEEMRMQLPDALRSLSACFQAGFTLQQTFEQLAGELEGPLAVCFARARDVLRTGGTLDDALEALQHAGGPRELAFVAVALQVQHAAGGSMQHVLDTASDSLASELALRRSLRVQTAQARLSSKVVVGVTVGLVAVLACLSEGFLAPFFESVPGLALLALAVAMQLAGIVVVRRLLDVEVD